MKLKTIYSKHFPFKGYIALTIYPWVFVREDKKEKYTKKVARHEETHAYQQIECLWLPFFLLYGIEYFIKSLFTSSTIRAYLSISFEQEAYAHEAETYYNEVRKPYAWMKYVFKMKE